jgi:hypothetical protein
MSSDFERKPESPPRNLDGLDREERVEEMTAWFLENFEDPAEHTPRDSGEGGYQFIWGGPYDALDQIGSAFPGVEQGEIEEAVEAVQSDGVYEWAPSEQRIQLAGGYEEDSGAPRDLDDGTASGPLSDRLAALGEQLHRIEGHVSALLKLQADEDGGLAGIGHNRPPDFIDGEIDLHAVQESIDDVRVELAKPNHENDADAEKLVRAETHFRRLTTWLKRQAAEAPANLVKGAVTAAGGLMMTYAVKHYVEIVDTLQSAADTISVWVMSVQAWF